MELCTGSRDVDLGLLLLSDGCGLNQNSWDIIACFTRYSSKTVTNL